MSRLEEFIKNNREAFDDEMPSKQVWEKVQVFIPQTLATKPRFGRILKWSMAASLLLIAAAAVYITNRTGVAETRLSKANGTDSFSAEISAVAPEAAPEMNQFARLIALKQEELKLLSKEQPALYQKFTTDINQLDSSYRRLKTQLDSTPNKELLIEAMVQNLQLQLNVLNQQLNILKEVKHSKKYSHEKNKDFT